MMVPNASRFSTIYGLDVSKATGPDRIPAIVLKMCSPERSPVLAKLYFKNDGERSDPGKYRSISRLPIINKIFESFINDSLTKYMYGFRAFRSTADILTVLSERIYNSLDAGGETRDIAHFKGRHSIKFGMPDCSTS